MALPAVQSTDAENHFAAFEPKPTAQFVAGAGREFLADRVGQDTDSFMRKIGPTEQPAPRVAADAKHQLARLHAAPAQNRRPAPDLHAVRLLHQASMVPFGDPRRQRAEMQVTTEHHLGRDAFGQGHRFQDQPLAIGFGAMLRHPLGNAAHVIACVARKDVYDR